ncbi:MAG TPA: alpha/beta fold hydrolase [Solirubrobacteraceae bacterium]|nr:alpha/beta fold hydrolase [Solirubrobacteraceae bacterium]
MPHAEIDGRRLHYVRQGAGEPLLLIQGMSANHLHWGDDFLGLLTDFDVVAYDHRGIGHSDGTAEPFTIAELAGDAAELMDALGWESAHIMGISMGGMVAQELALRHPERVRTLTLGCTYCGGEGSRLTDAAIVQRLGELLLGGRTEEALRYGFEVNVSPRFAQDPAGYEMVRGIVSQLPASLDVLMLQLQAIAGHDTSVRLRDLSVPTLVVHGTEDQIIPADNGRLIAALVPGSRLEVFEDVGHAFWWERPQRTAELLREHAAAAAPQASPQ